MVKSSIAGFSIIYTFILFDYMCAYGIGCLPVDIDLFFKPLVISIISILYEGNKVEIYMTLLSLCVKITAVVLTGYILIAKKERDIINV
jgi:hypothetical protein